MSLHLRHILSRFQANQFLLLLLNVLYLAEREAANTNFSLLWQRLRLKLTIYSTFNMHINYYTNNEVSNPNWWQLVWMTLLINKNKNEQE